MKTLLILGAGTGGTMVANKMSQMLDMQEWKIIMVDRDETHYYQPGFLFIPFGIYGPNDVVKPKRSFFPSNVDFIYSDIEMIEPEKNRVKLTKNNQVINYDQLVIATGSHIHPEETEGMLDGGGWQKNIFDFYSLDGTTKLSRFLKFWKGGRLVLNVAEMPIKCPVAPLEFLFLADWWFTERGMRDKVEIVYATPLDGAFTKPRASSVLGDILTQKGINIETNFNIGSVDAGKNKIKSYDEREIDYDLLVTIPTNMGSDVIERSGMGDELNFVPTDKHTLQTQKHENVWVIGDAGNVPASKAGSVAHFMLDVVIENILRAIEGLEPLPEFDGHANCYIESGFEKGILIDFNYDVEPLPGKFPLPGFGPFSLLQESHANHWGKMAFRWIYWNILLKGGEMPFESQMTMAGKWS
ncbi:MAG: NAD(P)/FAD-dependent oxidoreductase [Chloroflexi bacterium]|jgi:sulfide:quinone oxidoreductase|nr:NAD(P)/FAD-dependent oxidoreductase [Chloroflexota bacterium]MBT3670893.1 NAD(P)/FAD-dependent oxidoreductase [Chloroflexota bacterium]MBT4002918.1 NAD(P)/FAD-dependent oxidoreductase [Chloroflexota bacterium]MBT4306393.1 NAD(P)/FAD-dependent oxidoreductase [Chloroflexota bacterium]MBT4532726.1 NAD(P)/FAD-dependent oxidoreductase [Chloroflexota bacterium]